MAFVYSPQKNIVSVWRPIEFMISTSNMSVELVKVKIKRGGVLTTDAAVDFREFYVTNGEINGGSKNFKFDVSYQLRDGIEPYDGEKPNGLGLVGDLANEMTNKAVNSSIPFKVEVSYFAKNGDGVFEVVGSPEVYPAGTNEYMSGVVQSPLNGEDMYMGDFYKNTGQAKILSSWRNGKVFACGLKESLFVSFWLGSREIEGVYIKRYQSNGTFNVGVYGWNGVFSNGSGENHKMIVSNIGGYGINGLLDAGMDDLLLGDDVFIDKETLRYEVKFVADVASAELYYGPIGVPNDGILKDIVGMIDLTEKIEVLVDSCDADIFKRIHWLNRFGGMDSRSFKMFARRVSKTKSQRSRKALNWGGANVSPNDRSQRSVKRGNIENEISFEIEEIVDNEVAVWLEQLMESPCVYMEDIDDFIAVGIEDGEIVPSDTDEGLRVIKLKFIIDNTNLKIQ